MATHGTVTTDPVCGMHVDENSPHRTDHKGVEYVFCSERCLNRFDRAPDNFASGAAKRERTGQGDDREEHRDERRTKRGASWQDYIPLMVIIGMALLAASAKQAAYAGGWAGMLWMHDFMGFFLVIFSMFKFFDMEGFADGFQMYDLLAKPFRPYAYAYPFIELGLGLGYLGHWRPEWIYGATVAVMVFGSLGVLNALRKGLDVNCACMGTVLKVPLSTVALTEDLGMAAMAGAMLVMR